LENPFEVQGRIWISADWRKGDQTKYLDPLKTRMKPITMTEAAAARSPRNRTCRERREAESPVKKRAGTVPSPKETIVRNPPIKFWVVAALISIAQESRQGKKPVRNPKAIFDATL
jgi:hypothetical protein